MPKACRPYRAKTKGKVERPFSYIRQDFFLARTFRNLDDLNAQLDDWLATRRQRACARHDAEDCRGGLRRRAERNCRRLPATPFDALLKLERRVSHDGLVSIGGNYYSVPDRTRRVVEVHQLPDIIRILDQGRLVAVHPVLEGRRRTRVAPDHRQGRIPVRSGPAQPSAVIGRPGDHVQRRPLDIYQAIGERLATSGGR